MITDIKDIKSLPKGTTKEGLRITSDMGKEHFYGKMGKSMKDNGETDQNMGPVYGNQTRATIILGNGTTAKSRGMEFI